MNCPLFPTKWYWSILAVLGIAGLSLAATIGKNDGNDGGTRIMGNDINYTAKVQSEASSGTLQTLTVWLNNNSTGDDTCRLYFFAATGTNGRPSTLLDSGSSAIVVNSGTSATYSVGVTIGTAIAASTNYYIVARLISTSSNCRVGRDDRAGDFAAGDTMIFVGDVAPIDATFPGGGTYDGSENPVACYGTYVAASGAAKKVGNVILGGVKL